MTAEELIEKLMNVYGKYGKEIVMNVWDDDKGCYRQIEWPEGEPLQLK